MADYLLDSNVLIQHLRGHRPTTDLLKRLALDGHLGIATIDVPDAIIAATALHHDLTLLTYNPKHFTMVDLQCYAGMPPLS
ncbi:MAG: hypothetical protein ACP5GX_01710 [Anaerolineae bacterium]